MSQADLEEAQLVLDGLTGMVAMRKTRKAGGSGANWWVWDGKRGAFFSNAHRFMTWSTRIPLLDRELGRGYKNWEICAVPRWWAQNGPKPSLKFVA